LIDFSKTYLPIIIEIMQPAIPYQSLLLKIDNLIEGVVIKRPSKIIKTPYVADIQIENDNNDSDNDNDNNETNREILGHSASLGCCGLADAGAHVLIAPPPKTKKTKKQEEKIKCEYRVYLSIFTEKEREIIIGIYPKLAENLVESALNKNLFTKLRNIRSFRRETVIYVENKVDSRFDFSGIDENGISFLMEVKNVPLADYEDISAKDRKKKCYDDFAVDSKVAYFPDGYRKKSTDTVSPRALKHIKELTLIKCESKTRCIMCYVVQRTDANRFQPSIIDPEYREAVKNAIDVGVEIIVLVVRWTREGEAYFVRDDLPISPF
jgi:DNA-binding sugar fermentation-stimulating protein